MSYRVRRAKCCRKRVKTRAMETRRVVHPAGTALQTAGGAGRREAGQGPGRRGTGFVVESGCRLEPKV